MNSLEERIEHARRTSDAAYAPPPYQTLRELFENRNHDPRPFLTFIGIDDSNERFSYASFNERVMLTVAWFRDQQVQPGDRIATISHNHWHTVVLYFAAWYLGLVIVPVNLGEDDHRIAYILKHGEVKLVYHHSDYSGRIAGIINNDAALRPVSLVTEQHIPGLSPNPPANSTPYMSVPAPGPESDALIVYTSGTTGNPKGVLLSQRNILEDARAISEWHHIDPDTRMMCVLPIHHVNGTVVTLITPYYAGGSVVLNQKFRTDHFFRLIRDEQVHIVSVVPTLLQYVTHHHATQPIGQDRVEVPALRHIICGAGPLTVHVAQAFEEQFGIPIIHGYGLSETTCYSCYLPVALSQDAHNAWMRDYGYPSIGVALPVNEMEIHDPDGKAVPDGERGEIVIRGYNVMKEYYGNREANEQAFTHGWFRSGDEGFAVPDENGRRFFFITGRLKELIIRGGVNLAPLEIDEVINRAPGVKAGIAVGFENDWYGEEVGAYVQLKEGADTNEARILEYCRTQLPFSKCPKVVVFGDTIPVTSTGKYQRMKVAHLFETWKTVQFRK